MRYNLFSALHLYVFYSYNRSQQDAMILNFIMLNKTPDDGHQACLKHVEFYIKIKLRNSASC